MREIQQPTHDERGSEVHPAFGLATVHRSEGSPRALFQSDIRHSSTVRIAISRASRKRDLHHDWVHPEEELIEIEMSLSGFGSLISSGGQGSGVPVTIRRTESDYLVPDVPYTPRTAESRREVVESISKLMEKLDERLGALEEIEGRKGGVRERKEAIRQMRLAVDSAAGNTEFAVKSLEKAVEKVIDQAKADLEAMAEQSQTAIAGGAIELPAVDFGAPAIENTVIEATVVEDDDRS